MLDLICCRPGPTHRSVVLLEFVDDRACCCLQGPPETAPGVFGEIDASSDRQMHSRACRESDAPRYEQTGSSSAVTRGVEADQRARRRRGNAQLSCGLQLRASRSKADDEAFKCAPRR